MVQSNMALEGYNTHSRSGQSAVATVLDGQSSDTQFASKETVAQVIIIICMPWGQGPLMFPTCADLSPALRFLLFWIPPIILFTRDSAKTDGSLF